MPFTFAHPAVVILIKNKFKFLSFTALIFGSMAPDFEYFIRSKPLGLVGHTLGGFFYFNLPICFLTAYLFHYIVKEAIILNMMTPFDRWYYYLAKDKWKIKSINEIMIFSYSAILGMFTHIFWDAFTHRGAYFVEKVSLLSNFIYLKNYQIPVYKILQHGSTLIGFMIIGIYIYTIRDKRKSNKNILSIKSKIKYYLSIILFCFVFVFYRFFCSIGEFNTTHIGEYVVTIINGFLLGILFESLLFKIKKSSFRL